jgi:hypothetical protein
MRSKLLLFIISTLLLCSCHSNYKEEHSENTPYIIFLVDAPKLNYNSSQELIKSLVKHPRTGQKNGYVGHAWFYLKGPDTEIEGGHSGELGITTPKYFDGIMNYYEYGSPSPTEIEIKNPSQDPNPIKYLWANLDDGFFQEGSGGHKPTTAAKFNLSKEQFNILKTFILKKHYPFHKYSLTQHQCVSLITQLSSLIGHPLSSSLPVKIKKQLVLGKQKIVLWNDPTYSLLYLPNPDKLEEELLKKIDSLQAENALRWYLKKRYPLFRKKGNLFILDFFKTLPWQWKRWLLYSRL